MTLLSILATVFGSLMGFGNIFQAYRIFTRKKAGDISIITYSILFIGTVIWVLYGLESNSYPLVISNSIGFIVISVVIVGWIKYRKN